MLNNNGETVILCCFDDDIIQAQFSLYFLRQEFCSIISFFISGKSKLQHNQIILKKIHLIRILSINLVFFGHRRVQKFEGFLR